MRVFGASFFCVVCPKCKFNSKPTSFRISIQIRDTGADLDQSTTKQIWSMLVTDFLYRLVLLTTKNCKHQLLRNCVWSWEKKNQSQTVTYFSPFRYLVYSFFKISRNWPISKHEVLVHQPRGQSRDLKERKLVLKITYVMILNRKNRRNDRSVRCSLNEITRVIYFMSEVSNGRKLSNHLWFCLHLIWNNVYI